MLLSKSTLTFICEYDREKVKTKKLNMYFFIKNVFMPYLYKFLLIISLFPQTSA